MGRGLNTNEIQGIGVPNFAGLFHEKQNLDEQAPPAQLSEHFSSVISIIEEIPSGELQEDKQMEDCPSLSHRLGCLVCRPLETQPATFNTREVLQQKAQFLGNGPALKHIPFFRNDNSKNHGTTCHPIQLLEMPR